MNLKSQAQELCTSVFGHENIHRENPFLRKYIFVCVCLFYLSTHFCSDVNYVQLFLALGHAEESI